MLESTLTPKLTVVLASGVPSGFLQTLLAFMLLWILGVGGVLAGVVCLVISAFEPMLRLRRFLAVANLITAGAAYSALVIVGEAVSNLKYLSWAAVAMTCILGIPLIWPRAPSKHGSTIDAPEAQGKIPP